MSILDDLVVMLRLDNRQYEAASKQSQATNKKTRDENTKTGKDMEYGAKHAAESIVKLKNEVVGLFTALLVGTGVEKFVADTTKTDAATGRLAKNLGMTTEALDTYQIALREIGGANEDATGSIQSLVSIYQEILNTGTSQAVPFLKRLGINSPDELKDTDRALHIIARTMQGMTDAQAQFLGGHIGLSQSMVNLLHQGPGALDAALARARPQALSEGESQGDQKALADFQDMVAGFVKVGRQLLTQVDPYINSVTKALTELAAWAETHGQAVQDIVLGIAAAMGVWAAIMFPIPAAIAAIAAVLGGLWIDFQNWKKGSKSLIDWSEWSDDIDKVMAAIKPLLAAFGHLLTALKPVGDFLVKVFGPILKQLAHGQIRAFADEIRALTDLIESLADALRVVADVLQGHWKQAWEDGKDYLKHGLAFWKDSGEAVLHSNGADLPGDSDEGPSRQAHDAAVAANAGDPSPAAHGGVRTGGPPPKLTQSQTGIRDAIRQALAKAGFRGDLVEGITAGAGADSGFTTTMAKDGAFGIGQWRGDRLKRLFSRYGRSPSLQQQIEFLIWELRGGDGGGKDVLDSGSSDEALVNYVRKFMRPDRPGHPGEGSIGDINRGRTILRQLTALRMHGDLAKASASGGGQVIAQSEVHIGRLDVHTQATDAKGIARSIKPALEASLNVAQANTGIA